MWFQERGPAILQRDSKRLLVLFHFSPSYREGIDSPFLQTTHCNCQSYHRSTRLTIMPDEFLLSQGEAISELYN